MNRWKLFATASSLAMVLVQTPAWAAGSVTLTPNQGPSGTMVQIHVCGLPASIRDPAGRTLPLSTIIEFILLRQNPVDRGAQSVIAQNIPMEPCGNNGLGFGTGTGRPPVSVPISGSPGPVVVVLDRGYFGSDGLSHQATFTITGGVPPTVGEPPPVGGPLPDLIVERLGVPGTQTRIVPNSRCPTTCPPFIDVFLRVTVKNQGVGPAGMFEVGGFYRDATATTAWTQGFFVKNNGANQTSLRTTTNLNPGESVIMEGWLRLPSSMRGKKPAAFMAKADICVGGSPGNSCAVHESNETNNESGERKFNLP